MPEAAQWPVGVSAAVLLGSALVIGRVGTRLAGLADVLADRTGLGEAFTGAVLLGASTSLPGLVTSITAAAEGHAKLAFANALGGIAGQTMFLALADIAHRGVNLEHAAASLPNIMNGTVLIGLLSIALLGVSGPQWTLLGIHPASALLVIAYVSGLYLVRGARTGPMWRPHRTRETRPDVPDDASVGGPPTRVLWVRFVLNAIVLGVAGWLVAQSGIAVSRATGLSETVVGALFTAIATSLPELVTSISAVRRGALTLAVGDIIGGNAFDVLFIAAADVAYREGSLYGALAAPEVFLVSLAILLTTVLVTGLLHRQKHGFANIGFESLLLLVFWLAGMVILSVGG